VTYLCRPFTMRASVVLLLAWLLLPGCSEFNKALKSTDVQYKLDVARKYYEEEEYERALPLLEELIVLTRGSTLGEEVGYLHAKSFYNMKDYYLGGYYLTNFARTFPTSVHAEECAFLSAMCHYRNSPTFELDQSDTRRAIDELQLFLVRYPRTDLRDSCNGLIDQLRYKLEQKDLHSALQYERTKNYRAAHEALEQFLRKWPNSDHREEAMIALLKADHRLAVNSVADKKEERLRDAIRSYHNFVDAFGQSGRLSEAERMYDELIAELERIQRTTTP